jgi:hypothetical protein
MLDSQAIVIDFAADEVLEGFGPPEILVIIPSSTEDLVNLLHAI